MTTGTGNYLNRATPGVYVTEVDAFGSAIVGYTQFAGDPPTGKPPYNQPVPISSMAELTLIQAMAR